MFLGLPSRAWMSKHRLRHLPNEQTQSMQEDEHASRSLSVPPRIGCQQEKKKMWIVVLAAQLPSHNTTDWLVRRYGWTRRPSSSSAHGPRANTRRVDPVDYASPRAARQEGWKKGGLSEALKAALVFVFCRFAGQTISSRSVYGDRDHPASGSIMHLRAIIVRYCNHV